VADQVLTAAAERHHELFDELVAEVAQYNPDVDRELLERAQIAEQVGITERATQRILADLIADAIRATTSDPSADLNKLLLRRLDPAQLPELLPIFR
jgi:flagellar biosynthesis/type III secretory pathway protein FliH